MDILNYKKINGYWQVSDLNGNTAEGKTKEEAKRMYYLLNKVNAVNNYSRNGLIPTQDLRLDT